MYFKLSTWSEVFLFVVVNARFCFIFIFIVILCLFSFCVISFIIFVFIYLLICLLMYLLFLFKIQTKYLAFQDEFSHLVQEWNKLRENSLNIALTNFLYPALSKELKYKLLLESRDFAIQVGSLEIFTKMLYCSWELPSFSEKWKIIILWVMANVVSSFLTLFQELLSISDFWNIFKVSESCFLICTTWIISNDFLGMLSSVDAK